VYWPLGSPEYDIHRVLGSATTGGINIRIDNKTLKSELGATFGWRTEDFIYKVIQI
jgi:hypothetical protein